ncbi:MAG: 4Fe-4S binding protein [Thermodesulfovibrionales bacterium]|nr:4Fe-4S binding protein [Thermodesulfovibrionales bacterium]
MHYYDTGHRAEYSSEIKIKIMNIRTLRYLIQWGILSVVLYGGYKFYLFVDSLEKGLVPSFERPSIVDGFLPIGGLMAIKLWFMEGIFDPVHPAAIVILGSALLLALVLRKSFCGWICPVGTLSELLYKGGSRLFGKNFRLPVYLDYPLRSIKYLIMAFFIYVIIFKMNSQAIATFLSTPYWKVADIKMLKFFINPSTTTVIVLSALFVLSFLYKNFWCRYLCPYGALLGLLALISPSRIRRDKYKCISCKLCSKNCPSMLPVDRKKYIHSPECTGCLTCVSYCPSDCLAITFGGRTLNPFLFTAGVLCLFFGLILLAKIIGKWKSHIYPHELLSLMPFIDKFSHP